MISWTPEQITSLFTQLGLVVGGIVTLVKVLRNNRNASDNLANSVPSDLAHKLVDNQIAKGGTTLDITPPATIEIKEEKTPTTPIPGIVDVNSNAS